MTKAVTPAAPAQGDPIQIPANRLALLSFIEKKIKTQIDEDRREVADELTVRLAAFDQSNDPSGYASQKEYDAARREAASIETVLGPVRHTAGATSVQTKVIDEAARVEWLREHAPAAIQQSYTIRADRAAEAVQILLQHRPDLLDTVETVDEAAASEAMSKFDVVTPDGTVVTKPAEWTEDAYVVDQDGAEVEWLTAPKPKAPTASWGSTSARKVAVAIADDFLEANQPVILQAIGDALNGRMMGLEAIESKKG